MKEGKILVKISKEEAHVLHEKYGVPFHENGISHTYSKNRHYYLCENKGNMKFLREIRNEKLIRTVK